ncbi:MAG: sulfatase-like hydrolase/transferase [Planctomycetes bacterium]|nr:sulfatase-like hydrolase/transferase [Planctomycetota bacterium]
MKNIRSLLLIVSTLCLSTFQVLAQDAPPNFVFILADDQGWNALSIPMDPNNPSSGSTYYRTPRLAKLAKEGMRFSQAYSAGATCSPSRHAIQYSRSPASLKQFSSNAAAERKSEDAMANCLKKANENYVCAHFGKWHINPKVDTLGYDINDGSNGNRSGNKKDPKDPKNIFDLTKKANGFIETQVKDKKPFFVQISHYACHTAYHALEETKKKYETEYSKDANKYHNSPLWAGMNEDMDTGIGMVLDKIEELGIRDNTYVIYTADNGYENKNFSNVPFPERGFGKAFPIRSAKYTINEGGVRVPFIVRGPGIPKNTHSATQVHGTDIFPTILDMAGGLTQVPDVAEGGSLLPLLKSGGKEKVKRKNPFFIFRHSKEKSLHKEIAIIEGQYKMLKEIIPNRLHLYDLKADLGEQNNLAKEKPELTQTMYEKLSDYLAAHNWDESKIKIVDEDTKKKGKGKKKSKADKQKNKAEKKKK